MLRKERLLRLAHQKELLQLHHRQQIELLELQIERLKAEPEKINLFTKIKNYLYDSPHHRK